MIIPKNWSEWESISTRVPPCVLSEEEFTDYSTSDKVYSETGWVLPTVLTAITHRTVCGEGMSTNDFMTCLHAVQVQHKLSEKYAVAIATTLGMCKDTWTGGGSMLLHRTYTTQFRAENVLTNSMSEEMYVAAEALRKQYTQFLEAVETLLLKNLIANSMSVRLPKIFIEVSKMAETVTEQKILLFIASHHLSGFQNPSLMRILADPGQAAMKNLSDSDRNVLKDLSDPRGQIKTHIETADGNTHENLESKTEPMEPKNGISESQIDKFLEAL